MFFWKPPIANRFFSISIAPISALYFRLSSLFKQQTYFNTDTLHCLYISFQTCPQSIILHHKSLIETLCLLFLIYAKLNGVQFRNSKMRHKEIKVFDIYKVKFFNTKSYHSSNK